MGRAGPPRMARALAEWLTARDPLGTMTGDLDEEYASFVRPERGRRSADLWYWRQVLLSAPRLAAGRVRGHVGRTRSWPGAFVSDLRFALRVLRRRPAYTVATVATLALGLGINTSVYSVVDAVLLRPLPFAEPDRLVRPVPDQLFWLDAREGQALAERMSSFSSFAAWGRTSFVFTGGSEALEVRGAMVSWNHFAMLGAEPLLGRAFTRDDAASWDTMILSHGLWVRRFGADPEVIGARVDVSGRSLTVVGVMGADHVPMEFDWQAWRPLPLDLDAVANMGLAGNGRLRDGVTLEESIEEFRSVMPGLWEEGGYVSSEEERASLRIAPLTTWLLGDARQVVVVLAGAVALVLLLACVNVANLMVAQGGSRAGEFAVRTALGGGPGRVGLQLFAEATVVSVLGGTLALAVTAASLDGFASLLPVELPRAGAVAMSGPVVLFTLGATTLTALLTGLLPVLRAARGSVGFIGGAARRGSDGRERVRARSMLVALEMGLAVVLVVGAGLMGRTLQSLRSVDPGFEADGVITVRPTPPSSRYSENADIVAYYDELTSTLAALPGVVSVGGIQFLPMTPGGWWAGYVPEGRALGDHESRPNTAVRVVRDGYFETMRIGLIRGRVFTAADSDPEAEAVVVVNASLAAEAFRGIDPVGRTLTLGETTLRVVGMVGDVRQSSLREAGHAEMYLPFGQRPWRRTHLVLRTSSDPEALLPVVAGAIRTIDPDVPLLGPRPMREVLDGTIDGARLLTMLLALFGAAGLALGAVGVYGVTAQSVSERRREIGIRIALGAGESEVARRTVLTGLKPVALGVLVGIGVAAGAGRVLEGLLFGVEARDPWTLVAAPFLLSVVALVSLIVPAFRASRVDPAVTLREE